MYSQPTELYDDVDNNSIIYENVNTNPVDHTGAGMVHNPIYDVHEYENANANPVYVDNMDAALIDD